MRWALVASAVLLASRAYAQPAPEPPPPDPATTEAAPTPPPADKPAVDPRADAGWELYHQAFVALAGNDRSLANRLAHRLQHEQPAHPAVALVVGAGLADEQGPIDRSRDANGIELRTRGARAELALFQSLHGIAVGIELCVVAGCNSGTSFAFVPLAGASIGVGVSLSLGEIRPGTRGMLDSGTVWGETEVVWLMLTQPTSGSVKKIAGALMAGSLGGLAIGAGIDSGIKPTEGQVGIANSGGLWTTLLVGFGYASLSSHVSSNRFGDIELVATSVGLAGGAYLAKRFPDITRGQGLVIDAGGLVGGLLGGATVVLIENKNTSSRGAFGASAIGAAIGLGAAAYFTRDWMDRGDVAAGAPKLQSYVAPIQRNGGNDIVGGVVGIQTGW